MKYKCINVPDHVFDELTPDHWCPICDISTRPMLVPFEEVPKFEEEKVLVEENVVNLQEETVVVTEENVPIEENEDPVLEESVVEEPVVEEPVVEEPVEPDFVCESVRFGNQTWMKHFLSVVNFKNGDEIYYAKDDKEWKRAKEQRRPAWCYAGFDADVGKNQGVLYNYYAVAHPSGLAPKGWEIPSSEDIQILQEAKAKDFVAGHINDFRNLTMHYRLAMGSFVPTENKRMFWTRTDKVVYTAFCFESDLKSGRVVLRQMDKSAGFFVRCLKVS
jgi:hypothetical protein